MKEKDFILCELLVLRYRRGDRDAGRQIVELLQRPLLYFLRRLVDSESDAWDLLQETFASVFASLHKLRDTRLLPAFAYRTARNHALMQRRRKHPQSLGEEYEPQAPACGDDDSAFDAEDAQRIHAAMDKLSLPHREVLALYFLQDLSIEQTAEVLGVSSGTVKSRLHYAKRALRAKLEEVWP
jgi:RNA polymerase sigma-70 factor, ECF subfamily